MTSQTMRAGSNGGWCSGRIVTGAIDLSVAGGTLAALVSVVLRTPLRIDHYP